MFKSIWKGIKWFFRIDSKPYTGVVRKHNFSHVKDTVDHPIKVYGNGQGNTEELKTTYDKMTTLKKMSTNTETSSDVIESAKKELWNSNVNITQAHKELILTNCGFQRNVKQGNDIVFDPRLIQVINYAMNMYHAESVPSEKSK